MPKIFSIRARTRWTGAFQASNLSDTGDLVAGQVVGDDDVTDRQAGCQELLDIDGEGIAIDRAVKHQKSNHAVDPKSAQEGGGVPMTVRHSGQQALPRGLRPRSRAMLVVVQVSSRKTMSRAGFAGGSAA